MSRNVFILGAGASAKAGAPVMATFIRAATEIHRTNTLTADDARAFSLVFKAREQLQSVFSKAVVDIHNIEKLFGVFEMAALLGKLGDMKAEEIQALPDAIVRVISRTLERCISFPAQRRADGGLYPHVLPPEPYREFAVLLKDLFQHGGNDSVSVITFNYDLAIDYALQYVGLPVCYGLAEETGKSGLNLFKLHGSLNWSRCQKCGVSIPWYMEDFFSSYRWIEPPDNARLEVTLELSKRTHCDHALSGSPTIVPPTWNKGKYHGELCTIWQSAARQLSEAENIFVIGYSFPETDEFFRYFYALGSVGPTILNSVWIVNPDAGAVERFKGIFGTLALSQNCFKPVTNDFESVISVLRRELRLDRKGTGA